MDAPEIPPAHTSAPSREPETAPRRRWKTWTLVGAVIVVAMSAGLPALVTGGPDAEAATARLLRDRAPFDQAPARLSAAPAPRYQDTAATGITARDITVTRSGTQFGSTSDGVREMNQDVLRVGGKTYTRVKKAQDYERAAGEPRDPNAPGTWGRSGTGVDVLLGPVLGQFLAPADLAAVLGDALDGLKSLPGPDDPRQARLVVDGVPALRADTRAGSLVITKDKPYRVLRLEPYKPSRAGAPAAPEVTTGPLKDGDSQGMDLSPLSGRQADAMYATLETQTRKLDGAVDRGTVLTVSRDATLTCETGGCTVTEPFTGEVDPHTVTRVDRSGISATLSAVLTLDGHDAGECTGRRGDFPLTGNTVPGTLSCTAPATRTATSASARIDAMALPAGEAARLAGQEQQDRAAGACTTATGTGTGGARAAEGTCRGLPDPRPTGMDERIARAYDEVRAGRSSATHTTCTGDGHPWWRGAVEYRVPGGPDGAGILVRTLDDGSRVYGWTSTHDHRIQRVGAPHFADWGGQE
ncbi:hypothetical protein ABZ858_21135 [Streptomyces sp. NPDC047017]|uniref:hypothetical protein n=1 Tax=Streptomyces sp. NPDC047017 TaxID=3155024 RepID=UPI0033E5CB88